MNKPAVQVENSQKAKDGNATSSDNVLNSLHKARYSFETNHKSFDFSDSWVGDISSKDEDGKLIGPNRKVEDEKSGTPEAWQYRKYHQTAIYIYPEESNGTTCLITSNLPEKLGYSLNSHWETPLKWGNGLFNLGAQIIRGNSGVSRANTFMVWSGTDPLKIQLDIPVIDDGSDESRTNLMEALELLSGLVLPSRKAKHSFYTPPPSPLSLTIKTGGDKDKTLAWNNKRILVQLGGMLLLDHCVIEKVEVNYPNTKAQILHDYTTPGKDMGYFAEGKRFLHPLLAEVKITVSTIEALTQETFKNMLWGKTQGEQGELTIDVSGMMKVKNAFMAFISGKSLKEVTQALE